MADLAQQARQGKSKDETGATPVFVHHAAVFQLWADLWPTWKTASVGMGGCVRTGIDWQQATSLLQLSGSKKKTWPRMLQRLRIMQSEALKCLAEAEKQKPKRGKNGK